MNQKITEGYIFTVYGKMKYLHHAIAAAYAIRRHDSYRPIAIICQQVHKDELKNRGLDKIFDKIEPLLENHDSITGFKHNIHNYILYDRNLFIDSDIVFLRNPDSLWQRLSAFKFTITGNLKADYFFGGKKGIGVVFDYIFKRRERTLRKFGLTHLSRVQSGMMYVQDKEVAKQVFDKAKQYLALSDDTHFTSRKHESGRQLESCEWSLAMAMSDLEIPVFPWLMGAESPQLDYISDFVSHDDEFINTSCVFYTHSFVYSLRGVKNDIIRRFLIGFFRRLPGFGDYQLVVPYSIHFGWLHQKEPFYEFANRIWGLLTTGIITIENAAEDAIAPYKSKN
jgi:hypothetical protein